MAHRNFKANIKVTRPENDFQLIKKVGSGTYGDVFKALVKATGALAAVKIIEIESGDDFDIIQQEILIMQDCKHANIVQYLGSYFKKNKLWIVMELCEGGSFQDIYHVTGRLTEPMIAFTCAEMLKGLQYMHRQKKLHRDIKGANILLTTEGNVKLADFGVGAQINQTMGKRSSFIGTPYWMAPEVAGVEKTGGYDHLCDIWAVGITAIELAECQPPLFDLHPMKALRVIAKRNYTPPTLKTKGKVKWSQNFKDFLKNCLIKSPKKRPDADRLLTHAFCGEGNQRSLRELLEKYEELNKDKHDTSHYVSGDEEDDDGHVEKKPEKPVTVKRIQSKKEGPRKRPPNVPVKPDKQQEEISSSGMYPILGSILGSEGVPPSIPAEDEVRELTVTDTGTIKFKTIPLPPSKAPPQLPTRPNQPPTRPHQPPRPPQRPTRAPPPVGHKSALFDSKDTADQSAPPLPPPRSNDTAEVKTLVPGEVPTLANKSFVDPPPVPPRLAGAGRKPVINNNYRPQSQLFVQKATKNSFNKIFNECPLNILHAASWEQPETKTKYLLFASIEGIYSLSLEDTTDAEMVQIFPRSCKWVCVVKNILVSICGKDSYVYMHNLIPLHETKEEIGEHVPKTKGVACTMKVQGTGKTLKCCVAHNPYNNEIYLYAGRSDGILMLQWYEPLQKFMNLKDIECKLSPYLTIFEPVVVVEKGVASTLICVGVYVMESGDFMLDNGIETDSSWKNKPEYKQIDVKSFTQLEPDLILIAYDRTVQFIDTNGKRLNCEDMKTKLNFDYDIQYAICLPGSVLTFNNYGVQGKDFHNHEETAHFQDKSKLFELLCSDKIVVIKSFSTTEQHSNLYILANENEG